ncbi:methyltransferase domain-containing protein [Arcicella rosea]|uniref:Ubiquinone/menaquinone biosynthesis C-methylase UbiE n=1 Tax=Arcicella rosea TaxID=502909 RepID=A0A841EEI4_9BACT|nr:methyltransferase domain-containing protein [Arcicella rosea]MBB6001642.1 ubiquinone/menaquinone biosynthesis C-methylase UbiE [Arcicella rosea]
MEKSLKTYDFKSNETIASVGASGGVWEIYFASQVDGLTFYLQDINEALCNEEEIKEGILFYEKFLGKSIQGKFIPVIGTEKNTNLPENTFDKVLIINSFHEFLFPNAILNDCKSILKKGGILFIEEQLARYAGEIHEGCLKPLYLESELIAFAESCGFVLQRIVDKGNEVKIFCFGKA